MPYLSESRKRAMDSGLCLPTTPGDLTYLMTKSLLDLDSEAAAEEIWEHIEGYFKRREVRYALLAEVLGCLLSTKLEYERREATRLTEATNGMFTGSRRAQNVIDPIITVFYGDTVAPYEDTKIRENGDVWPEI